MVKWANWCPCITGDVQEKIQTRGLPASVTLVELPFAPKLASDPPFAVNDIEELQTLLEEIDKALDTARRPSPTGRRELVPTVTSVVADTETILSQVSQYCQSVNTQSTVTKASQEAYKVLCVLLEGVGNLHWAAAGLSLVAFVLNRLDQVRTNSTECLQLLEAMRDLGKHVVALYPQLTEHNQQLRRGICLITEGAIMCCLHMNCGLLSRFGFASVHRSNLLTLRNQITLLYPELNLAVNETILAQTTVLCRQTSMLLSPHKPEYPVNKVGLEERVDAVLQILGMPNMQGVRAVVLHGMGGIGKSTLGMALHAKMPFSGLAHAKVEVGDSTTNERIRDCQKDILERLSGQKCRIGNCSEGQQKLGTFLQQCSSPILLFVDNVVKGEDLDKLLPDPLFLPNASRILVTSRDTSVCSVLEERGVPCQQYPVSELGVEQARELLCMQVFQGLQPPSNRESEVSDLLKVCGGLPLALEVVGRYLRRHRTDKAWSLAIKSLQECRPLSGQRDDQLFQTLMFSYNQLAEDFQKAFLDITSCFGDFLWDWVEQIYGEKLVILEELALVKKIHDQDGYVRLHVHDLLVALGRSIEPGSRIWSDGQDELPRGLQEDEMGNCETIEGIFVRNCSEYIFAEKLDSMHKSLRFLILQDVTVVGKCSKYPQDLQLCITSNGIPYKDLGNLNHMEVLIMSNELEFDFQNAKFPRQLKVLIISEARILKFLPAAFGELASLHILEMSGCQTLQELPKSFWQLRSLRTLILSRCTQLKELPVNFERLLSLQILELCYCEKLRELPDGFGQLVALQRLDLCGCKSLTKLPEDFCQLQSLQVLHLGECESLEALPEHLGNLVCLQDLNLTRCTSLGSLPGGFERLRSLQTLSFEHCRKLQALPVNFGDLSSLVTLRLTNCPCLLELPESFLQLRRLRSLDVSGCLLENKNLLEELQAQQDCRVVCEDIELEGFDSFNEDGADESYYPLTDMDGEHDFEYPFYYN